MHQTEFSGLGLRARRRARCKDGDSSPSPGKGSSVRRGCCLLATIAGNSLCDNSRRSTRHPHMDDLTVAKNQLYNSLGDNFKGYLNLLKSWFRGMLDKESFDDEARKLLLREQFRLHNHFLISLLNKCQTLSGSKSVAGAAAEKKKNKKRMRVSDVKYDHRFMPVSPSEYLCPIQSAVSDAKDPAEAKYYDALVQMSLCSSDFALPDNFAAHLRMFVNVWESGLDEMTDDAVLLLNLAIRDFMKNIITALISFKSTFRTQDRGRFKYNFAAPVTDPLLVNSDTMHRFPTDSCKTFVEERTGEQLPELIPDKEVAEREAMFQVACGTSSQWDMRSDVSQPLSLWHLFHAMKKYPHCVPSHSIYSVNMTRILNALSHDVDT